MIDLVSRSVVQGQVNRPWSGGTRGARYLVFDTFALTPFLFSEGQRLMHSSAHH